MAKKKHHHTLPPKERWSTDEDGNRVPPVLYPEPREGLISDDGQCDASPPYGKRKKEE